ncbi:uncharacterized protein LOC123560267 [Mercenaria mercenaria]|uniref:uncharacterized protein LOC123560267 n=1 Tax=Mercenaria mercenaria TaxID=6596 RepID=UPI00234F7906|nr:uncharacterized protein LOC123560267 [Mercenaria mercenaria]
MTDEDFQKVGLNTIGTRIKIKQACRNFLKGNLQSQVVEKYIELSQPRKKKEVRNGKRNIIRNEKPTRCLYIGWKHKATGHFKIVSASKGGGQRLLDVRKDSSYTELVKLICDCYFPNGYSKWQDLSINDITYFIGNFTGEPVPTMDGNFTFSKYMSTQASFPMIVPSYRNCLNSSDSPAFTFANRVDNPAITNVNSGDNPASNSAVKQFFRKLPLCNVEEEKQHDWYKQMYRSLHRTKKKEATNNYKPTYQWPDDGDRSDTKSVDDINPYRPSYEKPSRSVRGDINSGYLSEPEYRSKMRSKSTSNVSRTARAL